MLSKFNDILSVVLSKNAPVIKLYERQNSKPKATGKAKPWITEELRSQIREKHRLFRVAKTESTPITRAQFNAQRNLVNRKLKEAQDEYTRNTFANAESIKCKWKIVNKLRGKLANQSCISSLKDSWGNIITKSSDIANFLNNLHVWGCT